MPPTKISTNKSSRASRSWLRPSLDRRTFLSLSALAIAAGAARARLIVGGLPFRRRLAQPPVQVDIGAGWSFFTPAEADAVGAIVDRLIPADELGIGGREAGCAIFIDRQLSGAYGQSAAWYLAGPAREGTPQQGPQYTDTIAARYRSGLAALDRHCRARPGGKPISQMDPETLDRLLAGLENGSIRLDGLDGQALFNQLLKNSREGFFADPLYGGNKDMAGWKMIGFPGARYDYRDVVQKRGEDLGLAPVSIYGQGLV